MQCVSNTSVAFMVFFQTWTLLPQKHNGKLRQKNKTTLLAITITQQLVLLLGMKKRVFSSNCPWFA